MRAAASQRTTFFVVRFSCCGLAQFSLRRAEPTEDVHTLGRRLVIRKQRQLSFELGQ
jgi:hypothetical protein